MEGKVKWFSKEKGYGFIALNGGDDHYFGVRDIQGANLPDIGDLVSFTSGQGNKGPKATSVVILVNNQKIGTSNLKKAPPRESTSVRFDDRETCKHCGKKMVPRLVTYEGKATKSLCPYCGKTHKTFGPCFIATAVYGDYNAHEVRALRRFRDKSLRQSFIGRLLVAIYYKTSPPIAKILRRNSMMTLLIKRLLDIIVRRVE